MSSEQDYIYEFELEISSLNEYNCLKPYAYLNLFSQLAEQHLSRININVDQTMQHQLAWVLMSMSLELLRPVEGTQKLYARTWYSARQGPYFRRELEFRNTAGDLMFQGSTFSVLLDIEKRTIFRKKDLPFVIHQPTAQFLIEAVPSWKADADFVFLEQRKVYNSHIDVLGHVNNVRYGEFAYDALDEGEHNRLADLNRIDISFLSELRLHDTFTVQKAYQDQKIFIRGRNDQKNAVAFEIAFEFNTGGTKV